MSDLPKSVFQKDGAIYLPLSWKEAYHLRYVLRQHLKRYPDEYLARRILRRMENEDPDKGDVPTGKVIAFPRCPLPDKSRVLIRLKGGVIVAAEFDYVEDGTRCGVSVRCDDGGVQNYVVNSPSMAEYYDVKLPEDATYE